MPLTLNQRKSLRDSEPQLKEALESIKASTGEDYQVEIDYEALLATIPDDSKWLKEDPGFFNKTCVPNFASCLNNQLKEEILKEAFVEATAGRKITFRANTDKKNTDYWKLAIENENIVILFRPSIANVDEISYFPLAKFIPVPGVYSLLARLDLKENKEKFDEALESIKAATGDAWTYDEASLENVYKVLDANCQESVGRLYSEILTNIAYNITEKCKDDMVKEAFVEATPNKTIVFGANKKQSDYWEYKFDNGNLVVSFRDYICNTGDVSYWDFTKLL
ncbi:hypothetical protein DLAC_00574 [Tieghemostelium lacteum]|uniref:Uncharacterized protein n=1 Tax=Tieghemostelium lacteum TaxID=361077 RepID=A0A152AA30_TIELA|nr:hypothetical protein DLAC_00574 [Tieghemostelium lacteum]|eukprot:KYR03082.1 hypothetical protein DLAC_00574 [Tieghemostelium lacteum]